MQDTEEESSRTSNHKRDRHRHKTDRQDSQNQTSQRRIWQRQNETLERMQTSTPVRQGSFKSPLTRQPMTIQETPAEDEGEDGIETQMKQQTREIENLKGQIAENECKTETIQRQTAYLWHKNSKKEEETGLLAANLWLAQTCNIRRQTVQH